MIELLHKDARFRGMMEVYSLFRDLVAHERMSDLHDKYGKISRMSS